MNIALKIWLPDHLLCFVQDGFMASGLDNSSLMKRQAQNNAATIRSHRLLTRLNFTSSIAGTPPASS